MNPKVFESNKIHLFAKKDTKRIMQLSGLKVPLQWLFISLCLALTGISKAANIVTNSVSIKKFYCVDARKLAFPKKLLLDSLQALANSNAPQLFLIQKDVDLSWRDVMENQLGETCEMIPARNALARFGKQAPQVVWSWKNSWSLSIATTLAGTDRALLTDHQLKNHEVDYDFNNGQLTNKIDAYRWALKNILPRCDHHQLIYLDSILPWLRDYAMQQKLFVLYLDPLNNDEDIELLNEILDRFPSETQVYGWASGAFADQSKGQNGVTVEDILVSRLSARDMMLQPADFAGNLSFYDQTKPYAKDLSQSHLNRHLRFSPHLRYVLLINSDGDNVQYDLNALREHWESFQTERPQLPQIPVAWEISPALADVAPTVLQAYYQDAKASGGWDEFVAGCSGYAYVNPGSMTSEGLDVFVNLSERACKETDITSIDILDNGGRPPLQVASFIRAYARAGFDGLWLVAMPRYVGAMGQTAFLSERIRIGDQTGKEVALRVKQENIRPNGIHYPFFMIYGTITPEFLRDFSDNSDKSCVVVSPTEMASLIRQWYGVERR